MSEVRQRPVQQSPPASSASKEQDGRNNKVDSDETPKKQQQQHSRTKRYYDDEDDAGISLLDIVRVVVTLVLVSCGLSYYMTSRESFLWGYRPWFTRWPLVVQYFRGPVKLTPEQLALYNGTDPSLPIYVAINGTIFDVSANRGMYGPGGGYNFFAGRDATRAFVTGCFHEDLTPDLDGAEELFIPVDDDEGDDDEEERKLSSRDRKLRREREVRLAKAKVRETVAHWVNFYRDHKKYFEVGKVITPSPDESNESKPKPTKRPLCEAAQRNRPKRKDLKKEEAERKGKKSN